MENWVETGMLIELPDKRLARIMPENEYLSLKARAEEAYARIERHADETVLRDVIDLLVVLREVEIRLLEERFREVYQAAYQQGARFA